MTGFELVIDWIWSVPCLLLIVVAGGWLTVTSQGYQVRQFIPILRSLPSYCRLGSPDKPGIHPLKVFASLGGFVGIENVTAICVAVHIGGPGAIFWAWMTGLLGMILKYAEIFLGLRYRKTNSQGGYDGGPMYFLRRAFNTRWVPILVALLLCVYGIDVFIFAQVSDSVSSNLGVPRVLAVAGLLTLVLVAGVGGFKRVCRWCSILVPVVTFGYLAMCLWIYASHITLLPQALSLIFKSAFTGHAALGGVGGSMMLALSQGAARGCYSADIGVGYASTVYSESSVQEPHRQAGFAVLAIFLDVFVVCSASVLLVLLSGVTNGSVPPNSWVQEALSLHFPGMQFFMPVFMFILGFTTLIAYFCVGEKCARFVSPKYGRRIYFAYSIVAFIFFSFCDSRIALDAMALAGGLLLIINVTGILLLRKEVEFLPVSYAKPEPTSASA